MNKCKKSTSDVNLSLKKKTDKEVISPNNVPRTFQDGYGMEFHKRSRNVPNVL